MISFSAKLAISPIYTMNDLEVLERNKDYSEFLAHAKDIPPTKRDTRWNEMVQGVAEEFISDSEKHGRINKKWFNYIESLLIWPTLKNDLIFLNKRASYGTKFLKECLKKKKNSQCSNEIIKFWKRTPNQDPYLAIQLIKIIKEFNLSTDTWPMFSVIALSEASSFFCKRPDIQEALLNELMSRIDKKSNGSLLTSQEIQLEIYDVMNDDCWRKLSKKLKLSLYSKSPITRDISFTLLNGHKSLSETEMNTFSTYFILSGPTAGPIFNLAWNRVKALGSDYNKRENVLKNIKTMDPLPGKVFNTFDKKKREVLLSFLHSNIPEYLNHYGKTCVSYLSGKKSFPNGNPTIECRDFFKSVIGTDIVSTKLQQSYKAIR
jgi:hypothetical protein